MFEYEVRRGIGEQVTILLRGSLLLGTATDLFRACLQTVTDRYASILLDINDLKRIDSAGLGELLTAQATASAHGGVIRLAGATGRVRDVLILTKLVTVFSEPATEAA